MSSIRKEIRPVPLGRRAAPSLPRWLARTPEESRATWERGVGAFVRLGSVPLSPRASAAAPLRLRSRCTSTCAVRGCLVCRGVSLSSCSNLHRQTASRARWRTTMGQAWGMRTRSASSTHRAVRGMTASPRSRSSRRSVFAPLAQRNRVPGATLLHSPHVSIACQAPRPVQRRSGLGFLIALLVNHEGWMAPRVEARWYQASQRSPGRRSSPHRGSQGRIRVVRRRTPRRPRRTTRP